MDLTEKEGLINDFKALWLHYPDKSFCEMVDALRTNGRSRHQNLNDDELYSKISEWLLDDYHVATYEDDYDYYYNNRDIPCEDADPLDLEYWCGD